VIVTLFQRPGCHLCAEAREAILAIGAEADAELELREIDIESDDELLSAYLERIPVIEVEGEEVSELVPDRDALRRALHTVAR
jgi:glutaredoxin